MVSKPDKPSNPKPCGKNNAKDGAKSFLKDIIIVLCVVAVIGVVLFAVSGTWPAIVAVESASMEPNINTYSLVFVCDENRYGEWMTQEDAIYEGAEKRFNGYGDVIVYQPNGISGVTPIIHRAIEYVTAEEAAEMGFEGSAAHDGVITKGDNNAYIDQVGYLNAYGRLQPVKEEWIVGKAMFSVPLLGWIPLNILTCALIAAVVIVGVELVLYLRRRG